MIIKTISYGFTKNLGNYQSERLDATIELEDLDTPEHALEQLKQFVKQQLDLEPKPEKSEYSPF